MIQSKGTFVNFEVNLSIGQEVKLIFGMAHPRSGRNKGKTHALVTRRST